MLWYCVKPFQYIYPTLLHRYPAFVSYFSVYFISTLWKLLAVQTAPLSVISPFYFIYTISFLHSFSHVLLDFCLMNWNQIVPNDTCNGFEHHRFSLAMLVQCTHCEFIFGKCIRIIYWLIITRHVFRVHWLKTNWRWCC